MARIILYKSYKLSDEICYNYGENELLVKCWFYWSILYTICYRVHVYTCIRAHPYGQTSR